MNSGFLTFYFFLRTMLVLATVCVPIWMKHFVNPPLWFLSARLRQLILRPVEEYEYMVVSVDMSTKDGCYKVGRCFDVPAQLNSDRKTLPEVVYVIVVKLPRYADKRSAKELVAMVYKKFMAMRIHDSRMFKFDICALEQFLWNLALRRTKDGTWVDTITKNEPFVDHEVVPLLAHSSVSNTATGTGGFTNTSGNNIIHSGGNYGVARNKDSNVLKVDPYKGYKQYPLTVDDGSLSEDKSI
jgi:hypothetical protein